MRRVRLNQTMIQKAETRESRYTLYDETQGLMLRIEPSGSKIYYIDYTVNGKRSSKKLGSADILTVAQAREATKDFLARVTLGEDIAKKKSSSTFREFFDEHYFPWVRANRKGGVATVARIKTSFGFLMDVRIDELEPLTIEKWRMERMKEVKASSVNRDMTAIKAALNWGVNLGVIDASPLDRIGRLQERDSQPKVRFLSPDERSRLMAALKRCSDYLRAMVIISLNTGVRQGALFALRWEDIDLERRIITLRGEDAKNSKVNHVPINDPAYQAFKNLPRTSSLVFPSPKTGNQIDNCRHSWKTLMKAAQIENFRWHDMRHDFASQLVMKGVDLNTVRELLGHSDLKMTLRYAHLAPEAKVKAVGVLD